MEQRVKKEKCHNCLERKIKNEIEEGGRAGARMHSSAEQQCEKVYSRVLKGG